MSNEKKINWGILATGKMANKMAEALTFVEDANLIAVASRSLSNAETFAKKWGILNYYDSYENLVKNNEIDLVYIATPVIYHYEHILLCLQNGKNVLCEKPLTLNEKQAKEVFHLAKEKKLFLIEAHWSYFLPGYKKIKELIQNNTIGKVLLTRAEFCHKPMFDPKGKWFNLELGGGALLDLGVYPIGLALLTAGTPIEIISNTELGNTGVDVFDMITFKQQNEAYSNLVCSINSNAPREALIIGEKGYIKIHAPFHNPNKLTLKTDEDEPIDIDVSYCGNGYNYEAEEVNNCLKNNYLQSIIFNEFNTLAILKITDTIRRNCCLKYPQED